MDADGYLYMTVLNQKNNDGSVGLQQDQLFGGGVWRYRNGTWTNITPNSAESYTPIDVWRNPATGKVRLYVTSGGFAQDASIYFTDDAKAQIYSGFARALRPGGYLFVGGSELIVKSRDIGFQATSTSIYERFAA